MAAAGPAVGAGAMAAVAARGAEAEALFEAHTAAELRAVERRLRGGIEQKREELRQMVGERYRDLIEAADTIAEMRRSSERLLGAVRGLQGGGAARPGPASAVRGGHRVPRALFPPLIRPFRPAPSPPLAPFPSPAHPFLSPLMPRYWLIPFIPSLFPHPFFSPVSPLSLQARPPSLQSFYGAAAQLKLLLEVPEQIWGALEGGRYLPAARLHLLGAHLRRQLQLDTPRARSSPILARFPILLRQVAAASHLR